MSLQIGLKVDAQQVKEAKRDLEWLNRTLRETESLDISLGGDHLAQDAEQLRRVGLELTRLGNLARTGDNRGGLLNPKQFELVSKLTKDIGTGLGGWLGQTAKLKAELRQVSTDLRQIQKDMLSPGLSAKARDLMLEDVEVLTGRREDLQKELGRRAKLDARAGHMGRRAQEYADTISGFGVAGDQGGGAAAIKKMLGYGLALWGGVSILNMVRESWEKYKHQSEAESGLTVRGVQYERRLSPWIYTPQEEAEMAMNMRRTTGSADMDTLTRFERFARLSNLDTGTAMGFAGTHYQVTGADVAKQRQALDALLIMGKAARDGRSEALLQNINANLLTVFHAQGNKALSDAQVSQVMAQTTAMYNSGGTQGMSSSMYDTLQKALQPGGDNVDELLAWTIAGGKPGPLGAKELVEIKRRRDKGLTDPRNMREAMALIRQLGGKDRNQQILVATRILRSWGTQGGIETAEWLVDNGDRVANAKMLGQSEILEGIAKSEGLYRDTPGYLVGQRASTRELAKLDAGSGIESVLGPIENFVLEGSSNVLKSIGVGEMAANGGKYDSIIDAAARKAGISPAWFKAMIKAESRFNRYAVSGKGACGIAQLMPGTFKEMKRKYGIQGDIFDPSANAMAGAYYMAEQVKRRGGDYEQATIDYNAGPNAKARFRESNAYLGHVKDYYSEYYQTDTRHAAFMDRTAAGGFATGGGLPGDIYTFFVTKLMPALDRLSTNMETLARQTPGSKQNISASASGSLKPMPTRPR